MHSVPEAVALITAAATPLPAEPTPLAEALGRVLAADIRSPITLPHWTNSAMDGYAVRGEDVAGTTEAHPVSLRVLETVAAGAFPTRAVGRGEATRIMTGAPLPVALIEAALHAVIKGTPPTRADSPPSLAALTTADAQALQEVLSTLIAC